MCLHYRVNVDGERRFLPLKWSLQGVYFNLTDFLTIVPAVRFPPGNQNSIATKLCNLLLRSSILISVDNSSSKHVVYLWVSLCYLYLQRLSASNINFNTILGGGKYWNIVRLFNPNAVRTYSKIAVKLRDEYRMVMVFEQQRRRKRYA